ncbi:hypothetical protein Poli38472_002773 [Pythium oligandrum]|uniref:TLC domain-containing protein n=1 Tax=Pythium oligandrum TaxID=41045 RepID=A0A8K1CI50_PYTOL|nr:hypothetical protein Poli38472_002773 [Pythium oligandrum]|eukprot:TMW63832.1 hypothetical protein Poli38472_002773 [Pythium oligandrum]
MSRLSTDPRMPQVNDLVISLPIALVLGVLRCTVPKFFQSIGRVVLSPSKRIVPFRVDRFSTSLFKLIYFWGISTLGYLVMKDEKWFPTSLGGSGEAAECVRVFNEPPSVPLKFYVLVQFAYQVHNLIFMGFIRPFYPGTLEFVTHDLVAMLLIASTYLVNYVPLAALVGFLNDACDAIQYIYRVVVDSDRRLLVVPVYLAFLPAWIYTRLYVFPTEFIYNTLHNLARENPDVALGYLYPLNALLIALQAMQVHWFWLFLRKAPQIFSTTTTATVKKIKRGRHSRRIIMYGLYDA